MHISTYSDWRFYKLGISFVRENLHSLICDVFNFRFTDGLELLKILNYGIEIVDFASHFQKFYD